MARKLRVPYLSAVYHVLNRGDRCELIFRDDQDRERFLATLGEACAKTGWQAQSYCLMPDHFHQVVETPQANLVSTCKPPRVGPTAGRPPKLRRRQVGPVVGHR